MSRTSIKEYLRDKRTAYGNTRSRQTRHRIIDEVSNTTCFSRKYVINLLNGRIKYRKRKGRGKTYDAEDARVLADIWREAGCPCTPYLKAGIEMWIDEYEQYVANINGKTKAKLLKMSDSTMSRLLSGMPRIKPGYAKCNKRSGRNNELKNAIPCHSGELVRACEVPPGDCQIDTFALGGGDPSDNFFWILNCTDRKTQWTRLCPTWNRGQHNTLEALRHIERRLPFPIDALHCDNGTEILNHHVAAFLCKNRPNMYIARSRPRKCNDNAHVEEKNHSVGRALFGERRIDCPWLKDDLVRLCDEWSDFCNFFRPTKMLMEKQKRKDGKGWTCRYDRPQTPYQRLQGEHVLSPEDEAKLKAYRNSLHPIDLHRRIVNRLRRIIRKQEEYAAAKHSHDKNILASAIPDSALRAAPSGTSSIGALKVSATSLLPKPISKRKQHLQSTQHLTNQKPPVYLQSTLSI